MLLVHLGLVQMELETPKIELSEEENELTTCLHRQLQLFNFTIEQHKFYFFIDYKATTDKVWQFILPKSQFNTKIMVSFDKNVFLNTTEKVKQENIFKKISCHKTLVWLPFQSCPIQSYVCYIQISAVAFDTICERYATCCHVKCLGQILR